MKQCALLMFVVSWWIAAVSAQTDSLNIFWDPRPETNIAQYLLQRSVNSTSQFQDLQIVSHPTVKVVDREVQPGNLYAYRVASINSEGITGNFSAVVSAAIPAIQWPITAIGSAQDTVIDKSSFLGDLDDALNTLQLQISQETHVTVTTDLERITLTPSPFDYTGPASFTVRAEDNQGFYDLKTVNFQFTEPSGNPVQFTIDIPDIQFDEDGRYVINLDEMVTLPGYSPDQLVWTFSAGSNLTYLYNELDRILEIRPKETDWFGVDEMTATAMLPDIQTVSHTFQVTVNPVNDPPVASIQQLFVSADPADNIIDLKGYAIDVDNDISELKWAFWGFSEYAIAWENQDEQLIKVTPSGSASGETGFFSLTDAAGLSDTAEVQIFLKEETQFTVEVADPVFDEDQPFVILMDTTLTISNYTPAEVKWSFRAGPKLNYAFNKKSRRLTLQSKESDWFGEEMMVAIATAPDQITKVDTFISHIRPVNDPPRALLRNLYVSPSSSNQYDLKMYATDVDDRLEDLQWEWWGFSQFVIEWVNEAEKIIQVSATADAKSEVGYFRVRDPHDAMDSSKVKITFRSKNTPPHLKFPSTVTMNEDGEATFNLVNYVVDSTNTMSELTWEFDSDLNLPVDYNSTISTLKLQPLRNWFGVTTLNVTVKDPSGLSDQQQINVTVSQQNDIQRLAVQAVAADQVNISLQTERPSIVDLSYWYQPFQFITISMTNYQLEHQIELKSLELDTLYHFSLSVTGDDGSIISIVDSTFRTTTVSLSADQPDVIVYPNPLKPGEGDERMMFANLPPESLRISLYNLLGEKIYEQSVSDGSALERYSIEVVGNPDLDMPSGLYIYLVKDANSKVLSSGKIAVIR